MTELHISKHFWRGLALCQELVYFLPSNQDNTLNKMIKVGSLIGIVRRHVKGKESVVTEFVNKHNLEKNKNSEFGNMFFSTPVQDLFEISTISLNEYYEVIKAEHEKIGSVYFVKRVWNGGSQLEVDFYHTSGFKFETVLNYMWTAFEGKINTDIVSTVFSSKIQYSKLSFTKDPIFGSSKKKLSSFLKKHKQYIDDEQPRTYLMIGDPGVGKSTMTLRIAEKIGGRALRLNSQSLNKIKSDEVKFLLGNLKPNCLIIDDIDKAIVDKGLSTVLAILEWVKLDHPDVSVLITVNDPHKLDRALLRPGRVDEIVKFKLPNKEDREKILVGYINLFNSKMPNDKHKNRIIKNSKGLAAPWLKEVALQLKYIKPEKVLKVIEDMQELLALISNKDKKGKSEDKSEDEPMDNVEISE